MALKNDMSKIVREKDGQRNKYNAILYIAAHRSKGEIGSSDFRPMKLTLLLK